MLRGTIPCSTTLPTLGYLQAIGAVAQLSFVFLPSSEAARSCTSCSQKAQWPPATCFWRVFLRFQLGYKTSSLQQLSHQLQSLLLQSHLCQQRRLQAWLSPGYRAGTAPKKDAQPPARTQRKAGCAEGTVEWLCHDI